VKSEVLTRQWALVDFQSGWLRLEPGEPENGRTPLKTESIYRRYAIVDEAMLKEGAVKLQMLHEAQTPAAPVIPLTTATRTKRVSSSIVRVSRAQRTRRGLAARAKSLPAGEKTMVGWDGIEPPTPGFSDLGLSSRKYA